MSGATSQSVLHIHSDEGPGILRRDRTPARDTEHLNRLLRELQTTLELEPLLELFHARLKSWQRVAGMVYLPPGGRKALRIGQRASHQCAYELLLHEQPLGEIVFLQRRAFEEKEIAALEEALALLVYPLRNALLYLEALDRAHRDPLTGIGNRAAMEEALQREISLARRHGDSLSIVLFDIDRFKHINDTWGHACGDQALRAFAEVARAQVRTSDHLYRYGGEEFLLLLRNTRLQGALRLAERIRRHMERTPLNCGGHEIHVTTSAGVAELLDDEDADALIERADRALYEAKHRGRNLVVSAQE